MKKKKSEWVVTSSFNAMSVLMDFDKSSWSNGRDILWEWLNLDSYNMSRWVASISLQVNLLARWAMLSFLESRAKGPLNTNI